MAFWFRLLFFYLLHYYRFSNSNWILKKTITGYLSILGSYKFVTKEITTTNESTTLIISKKATWILFTVCIFGSFISVLFKCELLCLQIYIIHSILQQLKHCNKIHYNMWQYLLQKQNEIKSFSTLNLTKGK